MKLVAIVVVVAATANALAFRDALAGTPAFFAYLVVAYLGLALLALRHFWEEGTLLERLTPRGGDVAMGAVSAMLLWLASWAARVSLTPIGTPRQAWLYRVYLQLGDPERVQKSAWLTAALLFLAIAEEIVWRGLVLDRVTERVGSRRGWMVTTLLYALALVPTSFLLRDPVAGWNPLLPIAAVGAGLVWGFLSARVGRLTPVFVSHMAFTYFSAVQFRWPT
jgi:membrane protease YdiL (CAAX protease family)